MEWYIFALMSALIAGLVPVVNKKILKKESALEFSAFFAITNAILSLPLLFFASVNISVNILVILFVGSLMGVIGFFFVTKSLKMGNISAVSAFTNLNPAILAVLAFIILGERITAFQIIGIVVIIIGAYVIESKKLSNIFQTSRKLIKAKIIHLLIISAIFYAFSSIIDKVVLSSISVIQYILIEHVFIALIFSFFIITKNMNIRKLELDFKNAFVWILLASIMTISYRFFLAQAVSLALVSAVMPIKHLSSLVSTVAGGEVFHEKHLKKNILACIIMLLGVYLVIS